MPITVPIISASGVRSSKTVPDPVVSQPPTGPNLSLFVTESELAVWKTRAASGPYKTTGDIGRPNSPGDWNRIVANKNSFVSNPAGSRWGGPSAFGFSGSGAVQISWEWPAPPGDGVFGVNGPHERLNQAAFFALVTGTQSVAAAVASELVAQINYQDTVFGNRTRWSVTNYGNGDLVNKTLGMGASIWLGSRIVAFDYLQAFENKYAVTLLSSSQKSSFKQWCKDFGYFIEPHLHAYVTRAFQNRKADNYTLTSAGSGSAWTGPPIDGVPTMRTASAFYHNRNGYCALGMTMAGVISGDAFLIGEGKRYFKEFVRFGHAPTWLSDLHRGHSPRNCEGVKYSSFQVSEMATAAEMLRAYGDSELYDYNTSAGTDQTAGQYKGQNRSLKTASDLLLRLVTGQLALYYDGVRFSPASAWTSECEYAVGQRHFKDPEWDSIYQRVGITGFPSSPNAAWSHPHTGTSGMFPAAHFCFIDL